VAGQRWQSVERGIALGAVPRASLNATPGASRDAYATLGLRCGSSTGVPYMSPRWLSTANLLVDGDALHLDQQLVAREGRLYQQGGDSVEAISADRFHLGRVVQTHDID
jgi:hypothetical protein